MGLKNWLFFESNPKSNNNNSQAKPSSRQIFSDAIQKEFKAFYGVGGGQGYDAASNSKRKSRYGSIMGPNVLTLGAWQQLIRSSRDAVRNSSIAQSAIRKFKSNMVGTGIQPHFSHPNSDIREAIQAAWDKWVKQADFAEQMSFYGLQSLLTSQLFEAGECFARFHVVDDEDAYFQIQLIETEQCPVYSNTPGKSNGQDIRMGIVFDSTSDKRIGYQIYKSQPYDVLFSNSSLEFVIIPKEDMIHVMEPSRPGDLRGLPMMTPVLQDLEDLEGYADAERFRKRLSAMFAFFITQATPEESPVPGTPNPAPNAGPGNVVADLEPGSAQVLLPGEDIKAPEVPSAGDYASFMESELHKFAAAVNLTYEDLTGNLKGVNFSSARIGIQSFRRAAEQFQQHILIDGFCDKVMRRWMQEAVATGNLDLPNDYFKNPEQYEACEWVADGFEYSDPLKDVQASATKIRSGLSSRSKEIRKLGSDPATVDAEIAFERKREKELGIITDTNANVVLAARETISTDITKADPNHESDDVVNEEDEESN